MSKKHICTQLGISRNRLKRYLTGNPDTVCKHGCTGQSKNSVFDKYYDIIAAYMEKGKQYREIHQELIRCGCRGAYTSLFDYCIKKFGHKPEINKYQNNKRQHYVTRRQVLEYIWSDKPLEDYDKQWMFSIYPELLIIRDHAASFRYVMRQMNDILLKDWIYNAAASPISKIQSFSNGILRDLEPVLNSVRYKENNAFLEGNVNRLKTIKRTMYGRAGYNLLGAKVINGII